jgi:hypothetical protein
MKLFYACESVGRTRQEGKGKQVFSKETSKQILLNFCLYLDSFLQDVYACNTEGYASYFIATFLASSQRCKRPLAAVIVMIIGVI